MDKLEGFWDPLLLPPDTPAGQRAAVTAGAGRVAVGAGASKIGRASCRERV